MNELDSFLGVVIEEKINAGATDLDIQKVITEILGILYDPIVLFPGGWEDTLPANIWDDVVQERFIQALKAKGKKIEEATDAEALAYLYTASLVAPMPSEWTHIYLWLGRNRFGANEAKTFLPEKLTSQEERYLHDLKRWIWKKRGEKRPVAKPFPMKVKSPRKRAKKASLGDYACPVVIEEEYEGPL